MRARAWDGGALTLRTASALASAVSSQNNFISSALASEALSLRTLRMRCTVRVGCRAPTAAMSIAAIDIRRAAIVAAPLHLGWVPSDCSF